MKNVLVNISIVIVGVLLVDKAYERGYNNGVDDSISVMTNIHKKMKEEKGSQK